MVSVIGYEIFPLSRMLTDYDENSVRNALGRFKSVHDSATESFLREKAIDMEKRDLSRTYLVVSRDDASVIGYLTLSTLAEAQPAKLHQELCGINKKYKLNLANPTLDEISAWIEQSKNQQ